MPLKFCMWSECLTHLILIPILCRIHSWLSSNDPKKRDNKLKHMHSLWFNLIEFFFLLKQDKKIPAQKYWKHRWITNGYPCQSKHYPMSTVYVCMENKHQCPWERRQRVSDADAGLELCNISLNINWPHVITTNKNKPLCGGNVVPAGRISDTFNEFTDCHFESCLTLEA